MVATEAVSRTPLFERYACPPKQGNSHCGNRDAEWVEIRLEKRRENCIFCDRACATDAVGKARVFLSSERPIGAFSRGQESLQFIIGGDSIWSDANRRVWETLFNLGPHTCPGRRELKGCRRDSLNDDKKVDTYRNKENIYGNCST